MARFFVDTSQQYILRNSAPVGIAPMTVACWYKTDELKIEALVWIGDKDSSQDFWELRLSTTNVVWSAVDASSASATKGTPSINVWEHACGVEVNNGSRYCYLNGVAGNQNTGGRTPDAADRVAVGLRADVSPLYYFDGSIAEVGIWNVALTAAEVAILGAGYSPLFVRPQSLVGYWPLIGRTSPEIDLIGKRDLTLFNSPTTSEHPPVIYPATMPVFTPPALLPPHEPRRGATVYTLGGLISV